MATATTLSPTRQFFASSPLFLDPLLAQFNYVSLEGVSGVAGPRIANEHTLSCGEYALTSSRYPQRRKKVAFDDVITTNRGEAYQMIPQAPPSPSSDGSLDSLASASSTSTSSSRSSTDGQASASGGGRGQEQKAASHTRPLRAAEPEKAKM